MIADKFKCSLYCTVSNLFFVCFSCKLKISMLLDQRSTDSVKKELDLYCPIRTERNKINSMALTPKISISNLPIQFQHSIVHLQNYQFKVDYFIL